MAIIMQVLEYCIPGSGLRVSHVHLINYDDILEIGTIIISVRALRPREVKEQFSVTF